MPKDFNSYGARRGNHEVMMRGTFANIRLRNQLAPGTEGGWTTYQPDGEVMTIYDAAMKYKDAGVPLVVLAGKEYGSGSSRDWAAKGTLLLGVRAVIAESFERIHRSNLVNMGVLPLLFPDGATAASLGLTGRERFEITGIADGLRPRRHVTVRAVGERGPRRASSRPWCGSIRRRSSWHSATAASCRTCCGSSSASRRSVTAIAKTRRSRSTRSRESRGTGLRSPRVLQPSDEPSMRR